MNAYREVRVDTLTKGDVFDLCCEVTKITRNFRGMGFIRVAFNIFDSHGQMTSKFAKSYYPDETVMVSAD